MSSNRLAKKLTRLWEKYFTDTVTSILHAVKHNKTARTFITIQNILVSIYFRFQTQTFKKKLLLKNEAHGNLSVILLFETFFAYKTLQCFCKGIPALMKQMPWKQTQSNLRGKIRSHCWVKPFHWWSSQNKQKKCCTIWYVQHAILSNSPMKL